MVKVFYSTPWQAGDIGEGINDFISLLPDDSWVVIRDADTMFLTSNQQKQIQDIAESNPPFDLIGCRTNRLRSPYQAIQGTFDVDSIGYHIGVASERERVYYGVIDQLPQTEVVAGMFMMFRKSLWQEFKFESKSIQFDMLYSEKLHASGKTLGIAQGLYLLHLYRYGAKDPFTSIQHIVDCHDFEK